MEQQSADFSLLDVDDARWQALTRLVKHDVYHLPSYAKACATHEAYPVKLAVCESRQGFAALPVIVRDLPGPVSGSDVTAPYGYPAPLCSTDAPDVRDSLLGGVLEGLGQHGCVSAFLRFHPLLGVEPSVFERYGDVVVHGEHVYVDLDSVGEDIAASFRSGHRQNVRALREAGFSVNVDADSAWLAFPEMYRENMRRIEADDYYLFPDAYFVALREMGDSAHIVSVTAPDGGLAAAALVFMCADVAQYHLSATNPEFLRSAPVKLAVLGMLEYARDRGISKVNLGSGLGGRADSLFHFKAGFSKCRAPFATARVVLDRARYDELSAGVHAPAGFFPAYRYR